MALMDCNACGKKTQEGVFCEKCGAELPACRAAPPEQAVHENPVPSGELATGQEIHATDVERISAQSTMVVRAESAVDARVTPPQPVFISSPYMTVEHDQSRVFVVGQTMNFRFALTPLVDGLCDVFVAVVFEGRGRKVEVKRLGWIPCKGERRVLRNINFAAPEAGSLGFSFYFGFKKDEQDFVFEADGEHKVWPSQARATEVVRNLEIHIQNSGHASDFDLTGIKNHLKPEETLADVIDRLHQMPPLWAGLCLYGSNWRPPRIRRSETRQLSPVTLSGQPPLAARLDRLTLATDGRKIHLFTTDTIRLGKNRQNDVVARLFEGGKATSALNSKISRYHCVIERQDKHCYIIDRGDYPGEGSRPSACGVFVDGEQIPSRGRRELDVKGSPRLSLAGSSATVPGVFSLELEPWACDPSMRRTCRRDCESQKLASLVLRRCDAIPETYVALWECFSLGTADPDFDGLIVWREGNGYGYATAETEGWLQPGISIQMPQGEVRVEEWNQLGL